MPATTPIYGLRYQELGDPPNGADLGKNLADDVETQLVRVDADIADADDIIVCTTSTRPPNEIGQVIYETDTALLRENNGLGYRSVMIAPQKTTLSSNLVHWGSYDDTTDGSANLVVTHGAGFTPSQVLVTSTSPSGGANVGFPVLTAKTSTTFTVRYLAIAGTTASIPVSGDFLCLA